MHIHRLDVTDRRDVRRYIHFPFRLYRDCPQWVPPFVNDVRAQLDPDRHPFYQHSEAAFFLALGGADSDEVVGRIAVLDNARYNEHHGRNDAHFYYFDAFDDASAVDATFAAAEQWAVDQRCTGFAGPMLSGECA